MEEDQSLKKKIKLNSTTDVSKLKCLLLNYIYDRSEKLEKIDGDYGVYLDKRQEDKSGYASSLKMNSSNNNFEKKDTLFNLKKNKEKGHPNKIVKIFNKKGKGIRVKTTEFAFSKLKYETLMKKAENIENEEFKHLTQNLTSGVSTLFPPN